METWFSHYNDNYQILFLNDLILTPMAIVAIYFWSKFYIRKKKNPIYKKYFTYSIMVRLFSALAMAFIFQYYYKGGDTITFFNYSLQLKEVFHQSPSAFYDLVFHKHFSDFNASFYLKNNAYFFYNESSRLILIITLFLSFVFLNTYMLISFAFALFCFYGCWKIFLLFCEIYPHLEKEFALACLFLPSVCFWGTGILKDPICLGALGALTYHIYKLFFFRTKIIPRLVVILICFWLLAVIKVYIILSFMPAYTFWILFRYKNNIRNSLVKSLMSPILLLVIAAFGIYVFIKIAQFSERYAFDSLVRTAKDTQNWLYLSSQLHGGSGYTFGDIEYTPLGLLKVFPKAVNVALFRPYIWEARKPILIPAALEGMVSLFFTIRLLYKAGFVRFTKLVISNPEVQFCLIFSLIFAFSVGFTSYNFGSLVRYKIPLMPFYFIALFIMIDKEKMLHVKGKPTPVQTRPKTKTLEPV